jgi:hypothetical protein
MIYSDKLHSKDIHRKLGIFFHRTLDFGWGSVLF